MLNKEQKTITENITEHLTDALMDHLNDYEVPEDFLWSSFYEDLKNVLQSETQKIIDISLDFLQEYVEDMHEY